MTAPTGKAVPILDFLLEETTAIRTHQSAICEALNELVVQAQNLHAAVAAIQSQTSADSAKLEAVRASAIASVESLREITEGGAVTEVKHVVRDADGAMVSIVTTQPPTGATR